MLLDELHESSGFTCQIGKRSTTTLLHATTSWWTSMWAPQLLCTLSVMICQPATVVHSLWQSLSWSWQGLANIKLFACSMLVVHSNLPCLSRSWQGLLAQCLACACISSCSACVPPCLCLPGPSSRWAQRCKERNCGQQEACWWCPLVCQQGTQDIGWIPEPLGLKSKKYIHIYTHQSLLDSGSGIIWLHASSNTKCICMHPQAQQSASACILKHKVHLHASSSTKCICMHHQAQSASACMMHLAKVVLHHENTKKIKTKTLQNRVTKQSHHSKNWTFAALLGLAWLVHVQVHVGVCCISEECKNQTNQKHRTFLECQKWRVAATLCFGWLVMCMCNGHACATVDCCISQESNRKPKQTKKAQNLPSIGKMESCNKAWA